MEYEKFRNYITSTKSTINLSDGLNLFDNILIVIGSIVGILYIIFCFRINGNIFKRYGPKYKLKPFLYIDELPGKLKDSQNDEHSEIKFSLEYIMDYKCLEVRIIQVINLLPFIGNDTVNAYVRLILEISRLTNKHGKLKTYQQIQQTYIKKNAISPIYNQSFKFNVPYNKLKCCLLKVLVYDYNIYNIDTIIGYLKINLKDIPLESYLNTNFEIIKELATDIDFEQSQLCIILQYNPNLSELHTEILEAKNLDLPIQNNGKYPDIYINVYLRVDNKKIAKNCIFLSSNTCNPYIAEKIIFKIDQDILNDTNILCSIKYSSIAKTKKKLGIVCLGKCDFVLADTKQWDEMLNFPMKIIAMWHEINTATQKISKSPKCSQKPKMISAKDIN